MHDQCRQLNLDAPEIISGPFHDAMALPHVCDYGMIFVRCKDGISHNPLEYSSPEDLAPGCRSLIWYYTGVIKKMMKEKVLFLKGFINFKIESRISHQQKLA